MLGTNYFKVEFPVITTDSSLPSGLANFTVRTNFAGAVTYLYAGDLQGQLWKLDFRTKSQGSWNLASLSPFTNVSGPIPMFIAKDGAGDRQPITMRPTLTFGPNRGIIVSFGTGRYLSVLDNTAKFKTQSLYALFDDNSATADSTSSPSAVISGRARLKEGSVTATAVSVDRFVWGRPATDTDTTSRAGWYFDFFQSGATDTATGTGERQISGFNVLAGRLIFGSVIPSGTSCDNGSGRLYELDTLSGNGVATLSSVGILGEPFLVQVGRSTSQRSDSVGRRKETSRFQIIQQGSIGLQREPQRSRQEGQDQRILKNDRGRVAWREINNYHDVRNAP